MNRFGIILLGVQFLLTISSSIAEAADTPIIACVQKNSGALRIVGSAAQCSSNETVIEWSSTGPQGPMGPEGPAGSLGAAGINGYNSLILMADEMPGCNCANGGTKFQVGLDLNRSGTLDIVEVLQTKYVCNGATSVTPTLAPITVTASASTQTVNSFVDVTATVKNADGTAAGYGSVNFGSSGSCMLYNSYTNSYSNFASDYLTPGGIASVALTNTNSAGGACIVYADYYNSSTLVNVSSSAVVTFVPDSGTTPVPPTPAPITVTASPSTQTVNSFVDVTVTVKNADGTAASYGSIMFGSSGSCMLYNSDNNSYSNFASGYLTPGGIASVALTNTSSGGGPCIVYADYFNSSTLVHVTGSALVTFVPQQ
jgi:hypothetical protein